MGFDLSYNYYFPFYTMEKRGKKKHYYYEAVYMHLSDEARFLFEFNYEEGKIKSVKFEKINNKGYNFYRKETIHISYVNFAEKINVFQNFLNTALRKLRGAVPYYKTQFFSQVYLFNSEFELSFGYSELTLKKGEFYFNIQNGKKVKNVNERVSISKEWDKVSKVLEEWESSITYKEIAVTKFNEELNSFYERFNPYLQAPKKLFKKEYKL